MFSSGQSTQNFVPVKKVEEGVAVLEDGSLRSIIMVSTINFALKSESERKAILIQFQNLLNTLDFTIQISSQSRELDIRPYIQMLENEYKQQENELLRIQIREYIDFIKEYTENVNIMTKSFFVIVPYYPPVVSSSKNSFSSFFSSSSQKNTDIDKTSLAEHRTQREQRLSIVEQGLKRTGLRTVRLGDEEIKELLYNTFNPGEERARV